VAKGCNTRTTAAEVKLREGSAKRSGRPPSCLGLPLQFCPTRGKPQPFLVVRTECFFGHAAANVGLIVCRQNPESDRLNGCHQAEMRGGKPATFDLGQRKAHPVSRRRPPAARISRVLIIISIAFSPPHLDFGGRVAPAQFSRTARNDTEWCPYLRHQGCFSQASLSLCIGCSSRDL
jgi:hypothetical protein